MYDLMYSFIANVWQLWIDGYIFKPKFQSEHNVKTMEDNKNGKFACTEGETTPVGVDASMPTSRDLRLLAQAINVSYGELRGAFYRSSPRGRQRLLAAITNHLIHTLEFSVAEVLKDMRESLEETATYQSFDVFNQNIRLLDALDSMMRKSRLDVVALQAQSRRGMDTVLETLNRQIKDVLSNYVATANPDSPKAAKLLLELNALHNPKFTLPKSHEQASPRSTGTGQG